jgi:toxin CcdB
MARFDVFATPGGSGYLLDCQADLLNGLSTRFCVPLLPLEAAPLAAARLNPEFRVNGEHVRMVTQFASAVYVAELGNCVGSLGNEHSRIMNAIDMLLTGV